MDYELMLEVFYRRMGLAGCEIVDVGAHRGRHALRMARLAGASGRVHAFEPIPAVREALRAEIERAGLRNIELHPYALSDHSGSAEFTIVANAPEESGLKRRVRYNLPDPVFETVPVEVRRMDEVIPAATRVRFIKIDVEGGEFDVLRGATRVLDEGRPVVAFECGAAGYRGYQDKPDGLFELFAQRGYTLHSITGIPLETVEAFRGATDRQEFWDYIALPPADRRLARLLGEGRMNAAWRYALGVADRVLR